MLIDTTMTNTIYQTQNLTTNQQKWLNHYQRLCERGQLRGLNKKKLNYYTEKHHITPKCMGGTDDKNNLVLLTPEEHYVAHQLLIKIFPLESNLALAALYMTGHGQRISNKLFGWIKRCVISAKTGKTKDNDKGRRTTSEKLTGRTKENDPSKKSAADKLCGRSKETHESVRSVANKLLGRTKKTHEYLAERGRKVSAAKKGKTKETCRHVAAMADRMTGETKMNCKRVKKMSETLMGRTKETHVYLSEAAEKKKLLTLENCEGRRQQSLKKSILPEEIKQEIYRRHAKTGALKEIHKWLIEDLHYKIAYSSVSGMCIRNKLRNQKINDT